MTVLQGGQAASPTNLNNNSLKEQSSPGASGQQFQVGTLSLGLVNVGVSNRISIYPIGYDGVLFC